jgi:hypothetical protein
MRRLKLSDIIRSRIVGHIELQSGKPMTDREQIGVLLATDSLVRLVQNNYRRRRKDGCVR